MVQNIVKTALMKLPTGHFAQTEVCAFSAAYEITPKHLEPMVFQYNAKFDENAFKNAEKKKCSRNFENKIQIC
jgi:hypothetical protein